MIQFIAGAAIAAAVVTAANSAKFKRAVNQNRRKLTKGVRYAKDYITAIDECAKEKIAAKSAEKLAEKSAENPAIAAAKNNACDSQ